MSMQSGFSIIALACLAGAAYGQQTQPGQPDPTTTPTQPMPVQPLPSQANPATPDQANPATYPAPADAGNSDPSSASSPHQRDLTSHRGSESAPGQNGDNRSATSAHQRTTLRTASLSQPASGMDVQTRTGQPLGTVVNIINDSTGRPGYVVIADTNGHETAVPYGPARQMLQGNAIVMDAQRLEKAPKVPESQLQNSASTEWQGKADSYWSGQPKAH
jgi:hypothetical protein